MKIGIITDPMDTKSSVRVYLKNLIENLFKIYGPTKIYLIHARKSENWLYNKGKEIILPGFYRDSAPSASLADVFRPFLLRKYKLDVIHYTHCNPPLTFSAAGAKSVCLITTIGPLTHPQYYPWLSRYVIRVAKLLYQRMDTIITESESGRRQICHLLQIPEDRVKVIPSGVDERFRPLEKLGEVKKELVSKYRVKAPYILYVGGYRPIKNGPALVKAFAWLKERGVKHKLVLVGEPAQRFDEVLESIKEAGLGDEVITIGFIPDEDLPKFYNAADLFVLPSFKESFAHVLVEAMACGCPLVTSNVSCMPEIVGDAGVLIDPYDVNSLAQGMYKVLASKELRQDLRKKGLERAKLFSWEKCARETLKVYEELFKRVDSKELRK